MERVVELAQTDREKERVEYHHLALSQKTIKSPGGDNEMIPFCSSDRGIRHSVDTTLTKMKRLFKSSADGCVKCLLCCLHVYDRRFPTSHF